MKPIHAARLAAARHAHAMTMEAVERVKAERKAEKAELARQKLADAVAERAEQPDLFEDDVADDGVEPVALGPV